ncbi:hypothetical protein CHU92_01905 [Flavobacterium cyanobacteriorum]|uniref:Anti-sigma factor n=1 Tax=Flavobacterium cyanobacteriorum TaxID=2022802 RepID=A0A255ZXP3_9FLAO|nr:hypothetical protein [Flavobacterium cyanobacteriorum]OYQ45560.1 hypothetical protein CHU92_01905 [Flavobacterium cyanobacteriorum]
MSTDKNLEELFTRLNGSWDTQEPEAGHQDRFLARLERKDKKRFPFSLLLPIAAAILILFGIFINHKPETLQQDALAKVSPKARETQLYFASVISKELAKIEKENSPETQRLVKDALFQIEKLEKDYDKLTQELLQKGESRQLIHAMITNLQTRIAFLEQVTTRIENTKKIKEQYHENNQL